MQSSSRQEGISNLRNIQDEYKKTIAAGNKVRRAANKDMNKWDEEEKEREDARNKETEARRKRSERLLKTGKMTKANIKLLKSLGYDEHGNKIGEQSKPIEKEKKDIETTNNEPSAKADETEAVNNKKDNKTVEASVNGGNNNKSNSATATITEPKQEDTKVEANKGTETSSEVKGDTESSTEVLKNVAGSKHRVKSGNGDNEKSQGTDNGTPGKTPQGQGKLNNLKNEANKVVQGNSNTSDEPNNKSDLKNGGYPQGNLRKSLRYAKKDALAKAKTPEERAKILRDYKAIIDDPSWSPKDIKADDEKFEKAYKKHESKIKALNKRESELENLLRKKGSESDKEKYRKEIEEIKKTRHSFYEKD